MVLKDKYLEVMFSMEHPDNGISIYENDQGEIFYCKKEQLVDLIRLLEQAKEILGI